MDADRIQAFIDACAGTIEAHAGHLTELDQAIGDGDHGLNMKRGFDAVAAEGGEIAAQAFPQALSKIGMTLVMKVGGASGPLYGSLFMGMGKAANGAPASVSDVADLLEAGIEAVKSRGKSDVGEKTMLDVLAPALQALRDCAAAGSDVAETIEKVRTAAEQAVAATEPMLATKGRASFLGERSIGHIDPGAKSSALLIDAVCGVLQEASQ